MNMFDEIADFLEELAGPNSKLPVAPMRAQARNFALWLREEAMQPARSDPDDDE